MINTQSIKAILEKRLVNTDIFIVDISIKPNNKIIITLDTPKNITLNDCAEISRYIEENLDRNKEDYSLEVTSPGLNQPFKILKQYVKAIGKDVEIITIDGQKKTGKLLSVNENQVILKETDGKNFPDKNKEITISFKQIKTTKYQIVNRTNHPMGPNHLIGCTTRCAPSNDGVV